MMQAYRLVLITLILSWLSMNSGCNDTDTDNSQTRAPEAMTSGDECHVCGMIIVNYPGPKGEAFERSHNTPRKFCSTRDMFAYLLQPETAAIVREIYVHDMADANWRQPGDITLVDARKAWYVAGHPLRGAMGPTLASFAQRQAAEAFIKQYGGRLLRYEDINLEVISALDYGQKTGTHNEGTH
ncbi:MAG: nitrous oxide reductase accessory protein NosL [Gammaproteobacteria bacterium]|nr:nitrous oxide reductase accessory protein NosL [Gammaproteobacteria bacterium]